jgi:hypothetical protein
MLRDLMQLLCNHRDEPHECLERLLVWVSAEPSLTDLDLDLRLAEQSGALDSQLLGRLVTAMEGLEREDPETTAARAAPDLTALVAEVASLETRYVAVAGRRDEARRLESATTAGEAELAALAPQIEQKHNELVATEARYHQLQSELEGTTDARASSITV